MNLIKIIEEELSEKKTYVVSSYKFGYKKETQASSEREAKSNVAFNFAEEFSKKTGKPEGVLRKDFFNSATVRIKK
jgi:hypothetical protein